MTPEENKLFIQRFVEQTINRRNLDAIDELVAENFVEHVPFPGQGPVREGLRYAIGLFLSAFPDIQWILDEQLAEGEIKRDGSGCRRMGVSVLRSLLPQSSRTGKLSDQLSRIYDCALPRHGG